MAQRRALCRHQRLSDRRAANHVAMARLGHRCLQPEPAFRPLHDRATGRRSAPRRDAGSADRDRLQPEPSRQRRGRHHPRGIRRRIRGRPRRHHRDHLAGLDHRLRPMPQPQIRPGHPARLLPALRVLQQRPRERPGGQIRQLAAAHQDPDPRPATGARSPAAPNRRPRARLAAPRARDRVGAIRLGVVDPQAPGDRLVPRGASDLPDPGVKASAAPRHTTGRRRRYRAVRLLRPVHARGPDQAGRPARGDDPLADDRRAAGRWLQRRPRPGQDSGQPRQAMARRRHPGRNESNRRRRSMDARRRDLRRLAGRRRRARLSRRRRRADDRSPGRAESIVRVETAAPDRRRRRPRGAVQRRDRRAFGLRPGARPGGRRDPGVPRVDHDRSRPCPPGAGRPARRRRCASASWPPRPPRRSGGWRSRSTTRGPSSMR